ATSSSANVLQAQAINANNLANANTPGFKADHPQFVSAYHQSLDTLPSRIYSSINGTRTDFTAGELIPTGRNFDIAVNGEGWLAVSTTDGSEAYIRTNSMEITQEGLLVTANQLPLLGTGGPITLPPG
ncbi:MAG TPA: flagellar hook-basal body complex protein, partial [Candidatus Berkiella sp.]|nr:flagellar hook-basal body complex protein [Candidatus Berkiella sp.]